MVEATTCGAATKSILPKVFIEPMRIQNEATFEINILNRQNESRWLIKK